jgi:hypothetical protein
LNWKDENWTDYYHLTDNTIDAAVLWKKDSYIPGTYMSISFQYQKHLSLGRGGVILTDDKNETLLIYSSDIANNKLEIKTYKSDEKKNYIRKPGVRRPIVVINRGYGTGEYKFNHCLIDGQREYLIENHLICIESLEKTNSENIINNYRKIMKSFDDERTSRFIEVYFGNSAINTTELKNVLPIYGYTS